MNRKRTEVAFRHRAPVSLFLVTLAGLGLCLLSSGCLHSRPRRSAPRAQVSSLRGNTNVLAEPVSADALETEVMRFADSYALAVAQAVDDYEAAATNQDARIQAVQWKVSQATAAFVDATGPNPVLNALDLVVLASVSRMVMEDEADRSFGPEAQPWLDTHRKLETNVWTAVSRVLKPPQQQELRDVIEEWRRKNPNLRYVGATRLRELAVAVGKTPRATTVGPNSVFGLLFLDPLAGLDPTAEALAETRQVAERAMYYTQRLPTLLNWQVQLLSLQLTAQPEIKTALADAGSLTKSSEAFARLADQMPEVVSRERQAAIQQVLDGLAAERTNFLNGLAVREQSTGELLGEARRTLEAGSEAARAVQASVKSIDEFVRYVSPKTEAAAAPATGRPFNVLDYGNAASQIGLMAKDLQSLLTGVNQTTPELARLQHQAADEAKGVLSRAFWLGLTLIFVLLPGSVLAGLTYQSLADKWKPQPALSSAPPLQLNSANRPNA